MEMYSHWMLRVCRHIMQWNIQNYTKIDKTDQRASAIEILILMPEQNSSHFPNDIFISIVLMKIVCIFIQMSYNIFIKVQLVID